MSVSEWLRENAQLDRQEADRWQEQIEKLEHDLTRLRDKRDDMRFRAAQFEASANFLDAAGHKVERAGREVRVSWERDLAPAEPKP